MTWPTKKLGEVAKVFAGSSAPQNEKYFTGGIYPFFRVSDLSGQKIKKLIISRDLVNHLAVKELRFTKAKKGSILFPKSGAAILTNSRAILGVDAYVVSHLAVIEADESQVLPDWLYAFLCNFDMSDLVIDTAYPSLRLSYVENLPIPLPPIEIQKKIVEKIEGLFAKIDEAARLNAESLSASSALLPSALHHIFSRAEKEGWEEKKLADICKKTKLTEPKEISKDNFSYIDITSVGDMDSNGSISARIMQVNDAPSRARKAVKTGDTIFATTRPYLKRIAFISQQLDGSIASTGFCVLRPKQEVADSSYVFHIVNSDNFVSKIVPLQRGASYPAVSDKDVLNQTIPLPPLPEQKKITAYLDALSQKSRALQELQKQTAGDLSSLKQSILEQAFGGMV